MYVCHCRAVTDRRVQAALESGARDPSDIARHCGAGSRCGGCLPALQAMLADLGLVHGLDETQLVDDHAA